MEQEELERYYRRLREFNFKTNAPIKEKRYYKKWYGFLKIFFTIEMYLSFRSVKVHDDRSFSSERPRLYAVTHVGRYDIETSIISRKEPAVFLWGDAGKLYKRPDKFLIDRLGAIFIDTAYRKDCHIGLQTMIRYLKEGHNININPEGAWNVLPNKVVMPLYDGAVIAAMEGGADIIPVAVVFYGKKWFISYGKEMEVRPCKEGVPDEEKRRHIKEETKRLRDAMASLSWELIRNYSGRQYHVGESENDAVYTVKREELGADAYETFIHSIMKDTDNDYRLENIEEERYHDKTAVSHEEAFSFIENLRLKKENAFLLRPLFFEK